jgi:hypothetical protein
MIDDAIRRGCREFCKAARAIIEDKTFATVISTVDYAPTLTTDTEVIAVTRLSRSATEKLTARSQEYIDSQAASSTKPIDFCVLETNPLTLRVHPTPNSVETLTVKLATMPTQTASVVDSKLFNWHVEGVSAYARSWLLAMPDKPWSNVSDAQFARRQFDTQASTLIIRKNQGYADLESRVEMRPFA